MFPNSAQQLGLKSGGEDPEVFLIASTNINVHSSFLATFQGTLTTGLRRRYEQERYFLHCFHNERRGGSFRAHGFP